MLRVSLKHFFLVISLSLLFWPQITFAVDPPKLISPPDNSEVNKSLKLTWEYAGGCVESGSCFRVEVDNSNDFSSLEKSTYTNNYSYSPQGLSEGSWNWRVKAKDKTGSWSDWSKVFKFSIVSQTTSLPPSPTPQTSQTPQPSPTPKKPESNFTISNLPSEINPNQEFEPQIDLTLPDNPNEVFYLKAAFKKEGSSNYFGQTYSDDWVGNSEKYSKQLKISTDSSGSWEGKIKVKPDPDDSGFKGSDNYIFKVGRYSDSGSGPIWSNEVSIKINTLNTPEPSPSPLPEEEISEKEREKIDITASLLNSPEKNYEIQIASVAGESKISNNTTSEPKTRILAEKNVNWFLVTLGIGVLAIGSGFVLYKMKKEEIHAKSLH